MYFIMVYIINCSIIYTINYLFLCKIALSYHHAPLNLLHPLFDFKRLRNASHIYACTYPKPKIYGYGRNVHHWHFPWPKCPWPKCPRPKCLWPKCPSTEYFWGYKDLWIFLGVITNWTIYLEVISMHFRVFSESQGTESWNIFWGLLKFQIFIWGA